MGCDGHTPISLSGFYKTGTALFEVREGGKLFFIFFVFFFNITDRKTRAEITRGDLAAAALLD